MNKSNRKLLTFENFAYFLAVVACIFAAFNNYLDFIPMEPNDKIKFDLTLILSVLIVFAYEGFTEKIGHWRKMQLKIDDIYSKIEPPDPNRLLLTGPEVPDFGTSLNNYTDFWLSGTNLFHFFDTYSKRIEQYAKSGKHFRFLIVDPENVSLLTSFYKSNDYSGETITGLQERGRKTLCIIQNLQKVTPKGRIEVKIADHLFTNSYAFFDGDKPNGRINITMYGYNLQSGDRLTIILKFDKNSNSRYCHHFDQFMNMWKKAQYHNVLRA